MEEVHETGESLAIREQPPREDKKFELIPEGVYEAEYMGLKTEAYSHPKYGPKKKVRLQFRISKGKLENRKTSYSKDLYRNKETGEFYIPADSDLAKMIKVITRGGLEINDSHKGRKVLIEITHQQNKDKSKTWDFATRVMKMNEDEEAPAPAKAAAPAPVQAAAKPAAAPAAAAPAAQPAAQPAAKPASELLSDLTELGDFKL